MAINSIPGPNGTTLQQTITTSGVLDFGVPRDFYFILTGGGGGGGVGKAAGLNGAGTGGGAAGAIMGRTFGKRFYVTIGAGGAAGTVNQGGNGGFSFLTKLLARNNASAGGTTYTNMRAFSITAAGGGGGAGNGNPPQSGQPYNNATPTIYDITTYNNLVGDSSSTGGQTNVIADPVAFNFYPNVSSSGLGNLQNTDLNGWTNNSGWLVSGTSTTGMGTTTVGFTNPFQMNSLTISPTSATYVEPYKRFTTTGVGLQGPARGGSWPGAGSTVSGYAGDNALFCGGGGSGGGNDATAYNGTGGANLFFEPNFSIAGTTSFGAGGHGGAGIVSNGSLGNNTSGAGGAGGVGGGGGGGGGCVATGTTYGGAGGSGALMIFY